MLPVANPKVIFKSMPDGAVLFSTADEVYFGLNEVGARVWELLPPATHTLDDLCEAVHRQYPTVPVSTIRADVIELLDELAAQGLVLAPTPGAHDGDAATQPRSQAD
jgi:hypothetical protein